MALDFFVILLGGAIGMLIILVFQNGDIGSQKKFEKPPSITKRWKIKHPNGMVSFVKHRRKNENGKMLWKLNGVEDEIPAEIPYDVIVQPGAESGQPSAFFVFRYNPDGAEQPWEDPSYQNYFDEKELEKKDLLKKLSSGSRVDEYATKARTAISRSIDNSMDSEHAEEIYSSNKKLLAMLLHKRGGKAGGGMEDAEQTTVSKEQS